MRLTDTERAKLFSLVHKGTSLNQMTRIMNRSKTTLYHHVRKMRGLTVIPIKINNDEARIGEFIGVFAGDGCAYKDKNGGYVVKFCFGVYETDYVMSFLESVLLPLCGKRPHKYQQQGRLVLVYQSKILHKLIKEYLVWDETDKKTYSVCLKKRAHTELFVKSFLRGCLDSDGYVSKHKILFGGVSKPLMEDIQHFLKKSAIKHSVYVYRSKRPGRRALYHIYIHKSSHGNFLMLIHPRNIKSMRPTGIEPVSTAGFAFRRMEGSNSTIEPQAQ